MAILLVALVGVVGVAMFVSRTADHGEARFDKDGRPLKKGEKLQPKPREDAIPAKRIDEE